MDSHGKVQQFLIPFRHPTSMEVQLSGFCRGMSRPGSLGCAVGGNMGYDHQGLRSRRSSRSQFQQSSRRVPEGPAWAEVLKRDESPAPVWDRGSLEDPKIEPEAVELVPGSFLVDLIIRSVFIAKWTSAIHLISINLVPFSVSIGWQMD